MKLTHKVLLLYNLRHYKLTFGFSIAMPYKSFAQFKNITLKSGLSTDPNHHYLATLDTPLSDSDAFTNEIYLIYRRSEYAAQVELACCKIFNALMGYGPEMEIVQEGERFYIASRGIRCFSEGYEVFKEPPTPEQITGIAATRIIYYFLAGTDNHSGNSGVQCVENIYRAFRIDMAEALDLKVLAREVSLNSLERLPYIVEQDIDGDSPLFLPRSFVSSAAFQQEKNEFIRRIANTPFSFFEAIIRETLTCDHYSHLLAEQKILTELFPDPHFKKQSLKALLKIDMTAHSIDYLVCLLKKRHEQWCMLVKDHSEIIQDDTLADYQSFCAELDRYHSISPDKEIDSDDEHEPLLHAFPDLYFYKKNDCWFSSSILGPDYIGVQPTARGFEQIANYYAKKYNINIIVYVDPDTKNYASIKYNSSKTRYDFVLDTILARRAASAAAPDIHNNRTGFILVSGSHATALIYDKNQGTEYIYQFDSLGDDGPFEPITSSILTQKYIDAFRNFDVYVNRDRLQVDSTSCYLFALYLLKTLLPLSSSLLLKNPKQETETIFYKKERKTFSYFSGQLLPICHKVTQNHRCIDERSFAEEIKPKQTLQAARARFTMRVDLTTSQGEHYPGCQLNYKIYAYGKKIRDRLGFFEKVQESENKNPEGTCSSSLS